jgi:gingipain R
VFLAVVLVASATASAYGRDHDLVQVSVQENTVDRIVLHYELGDFSTQAVTIDGKVYQQVSLGKEALMLMEGSPSLPHVCRSIIIPDSGQMAVKVIDAQWVDAKGIDLAPSKGNLLRTVNPDDVPYTFGPAYKTDAFYPGELAGLGEPYILRDYRGVVVELKPLQYNPVTRLLRFYKSVTLEVANVAPGGINTLDRGARSGTTSPAFEGLYQHHFLNYQPVPRYAPLDEIGNMLIVCHDPWLANIQPLVDHKNAVGINTTAVGVSTIPGGNTSTAIKNYIQGVYNAGDLAFVLLVGDSAQIATPSASGGSSDPTYSKLAGSDDYPDIMVGRFSAETSAQVDTQVQRTIEYENMPATLQTWFWRGTGIGSEYGVGDDNEYDYQHIANIRTQLLAHGYTQVDEFYGNQSPPPGTTQVTNALNNGRGIINYCGHGSTTSWSTTGFSNSNVAALQNDNMLPFIFSVACVNGQFAGYTCFAEAWLRSIHNGEPIGAIGAYMSSINQSWDPPMEAQDEFNILYCLASPAYFCYGTLCYAGSCSMMDDYTPGNPNGAGVDMFNTWHVFGDPSLRIIGTAELPHGLKVTPAEGLAANGPVGGPFSPGSKAYTLENKNATPMGYNVTAGQPWITILNGTGTLSGSGTTTVTVQVNSSANGLAKGSYSDTVSFVNTTDHDGDTTRSVALAVGGAAWDPVAQNKNVSASPYAPADIELIATDPNGDPLTYVIESLPLANKGLLVDPGAGQIASTPYTLVGGGRIVRYLPPFGKTVTASLTFSAWDATAQSNIATVTVTVGTSAPAKTYNFTMDTDPGWATNGAWAFGHPTGGGSHNHDPSNGYTGTNVYGYNLNGDYPNNMTQVQYLTTTAIDCSNLTGAELRFRRQLGVESSSYDHANLQVSNNGTTWTTLWQNGMVNINESSWSLQTYNIASVADGHATVYIRWGMGTTDPGTTYAGWNIDDVEIWGVVNFSCSGSLLGDVNLDGKVDGLDVQPFVEIVLAPYAPTVTMPEFCTTDVNGDGFVTLADVALFVDALLAP